MTTWITDLNRRRWLLTLAAWRAVMACAPGVLVTSAQAQTKPHPAVIQGLGGWLYTRYDLMQPDNQAETAADLDLIAEASNALASKGIALVVAMVPAKLTLMRVGWPAGWQPSDYHSGYYTTVIRAMRQRGVHAVDLLTPMQQAVQEPGDPLFFRLDTHWTPHGAHAAAQGLAQGLRAQPALSRAIDQAPTVDFQLNWQRLTRPSKLRDLARLVGLDRSADEERYTLFTVHRQDTQASAGGLTGIAPVPQIFLAGSSFSGEWTGFAGALRHALRRDVANFSINADAGPWAVLLACLGDEGLQGHPPRILIWEFPERGLAAGPTSSWRDPRWQMTPQAWRAELRRLVAQLP